MQDHQAVHPMSVDPPKNISQEANPPEQDHIADQARLQVHH